MKSINFFLLLFTFSCSFGQTDTSLQQVQVVDTLKQQLNLLPNSVTDIQKKIEDGAMVQDRMTREQNLKSTKDTISFRQADVIKLCARYNERFAQGTIATETIISALSSGITIAKLSSPFESPTFRKNYDNWLSKWGKFLPAVILPTASLFFKDNNVKSISVAVGMSLTTIISAISKSDNKREKDMVLAIENVTSTIELFDFNRVVYGDLQKLKNSILSFQTADPDLYQNYKSYWRKNIDLAEKDRVDIIKDPRFLSYIDSSTIYFDRFQVKLVRLNYILDQAEGMLKSYEARNEYISKTDTSGSQIKIDINVSIMNLREAYDNHTKNWKELQATFYTITPVEARKFDSFYQLEEIKRNLEL